jgi:glycosyltransferase involved in cell wall biosynthesis
MLVEALGVGGKERQAVELVKALVREPEIECLVVCVDGDDFYLTDLTQKGLSATFLSRRWRWDPTIFWGLYRIVRRFAPHVIHTNGLMSSFYGLPVARWRRAPLVNGSIRNAFVSDGFRWTLERLLLKVSDCRVANSYAGLRSRGFSAEDGVSFVVYNGFDFARLENLGCTSDDVGRNGEGERLKRVGMVAEFSRYKDQATFIRMARQLSGERSDVVFVLVGDGPALEACRAAAAGVEAIQFLGKRKNVESIVRTFDIGVLCTFVEGLPNSVMEYMALRRPVVATDGGGTRELVIDGETGFLVPPSDPEALADRVRCLLDHPEVAHRMGAAGEARLKREFSIAGMVAGTIAVYRRALADADRRRGVHRSSPRSAGN